MATIIWCDHVRHIVQESRTEVERVIASVKGYRAATKGESGMDPCQDPHGFVYVTPENSSTQRALNVALISSFEAVQGDGI
jgi:hypothetical protein